MRIVFLGLCFTDTPGAHFTHSAGYVLLSYLIAVVGSYTAFELVEWLRHHPSRLWHLTASTTLGGSIWAMHFMGMLAARIDRLMSFEPWSTLLSLVICIVFVGAGLKISLSGPRTPARITVAGVVLGLGIASMHYVGMAALRVPGTITYTPGLWAISVMIAMVAAAVALWLLLTLNAGWHRVLAALIMAAAICGMHYTGMAATAVQLDGLSSAKPGLASGPLAIAVAGITLALLSLALVSVSADRRLAEASAHEADMLRRANAELRATQREIVARLCTAGEFRDNDTGAHVTRMAHVTHRLALALGCDADFAEQLRAAAPLHDIGKIGIADAILFKPGSFTPSERAQMQEHALLGARILGGSDLPLLKLAAEIAESHHEKWDGSGYPYGLRQTEIPISSRIVAVADVFDALLSKRPYKQAWSLERVIDFMRDQSGKHFDPRIVDALLANQAEIIAVWREHADRSHSLTHNILPVNNDSANAFVIAALYQPRGDRPTSESKIGVTSRATVHSETLGETV